MRKVKQTKPKSRVGAHGNAPVSEPVAPPDEVLDLTAAADFLKVSKPTFYRWLAQERIKGFKAGTQWRFYRRDLQKFLESEEPSALMVDSDALRAAVERARKARRLKPIEWPEAETAEAATVIGIVNTLITEAIDGGASDIHIDVNADGTLVRYRIDGVLNEIMTLPRDAARALISRLKLMADMDISERRLPQNGRIAVEHQGREYDLRVTTIPAVFGESAISRILDQNIVLITLDVLGLSDSTRRDLERLLGSPQGMIVATGPAGSGRTTTLYSCLNVIASPRIKICTIEDPVEYRIPNAMQVHVNRKAGLTFPVALRQFMRADPDVILVGELRDMDTIQASIAAAMAGHLVLTTMLPQDACSAVNRPIDVGVEPFLVASSLVAVLAQRLVRRVCEHCREPYKLSADMLHRLYEKTSLDVTHAKFVRGKGCKECYGYGYRGRTGVFELLEVDDRLRELIAKPSSTDDLRAAAVEGGMTTLLKDGVEKAMQGITTIEEVMRVLAH